MADGGSSIKQFSEEVTQATGEIAKDIKDSVGQALEQGAQSVVGTTLTPQQIQQKQQQDQKDLTEARRKISFFQKTDQEQKIARDQNKQKEAQRLQNQQQEEQVKVQQTQIKQTLKKVKLSEEVLRTQAEFKVGKGVGG